MGLSGSDLAYKQARAGIMRAGASRANYFTYNVVVRVNSVDVTAFVMMDTLLITQALNDEPDTARFGIKPNSGIIPLAGQIVSVSLGSARNREFGGQVLRVTNRFEKTVDGPLSFLEVECVDYGRLLDRRLVLKEYAAMSASTIAADLIDNYTTGFTRQGIQAGMMTVDLLPITNETVQSALRRLANMIDGGFYADSYRDVHLFGSAGDTAPNAGTNPAALNETLDTLRAFSYTSDVSQLRTRVTVEGQLTTSLIGSPGSTDSGTQVAINYLLAAGGASGGHTSSSINAGGAGGGVLDGSTLVASGSYAIVIGPGASAAFPGGNGSDTTAFGLTALGGGQGSADSGFGVAGGCGGGGTGTRPFLRNGGAGTSGQGYAGGFGGYYFDSDSELFFSIGGGGGGAGGVGGNAEYNLNDTGFPGAGGIGRLSSISGTPTYYGGGGAGSSGTGQTNSGGPGGGGNTGVAGTANTGGGGGAGAAGGSGIVIISYVTGSLSASGGTMTTAGGRTIHTFTSSGTFTVSTVTITSPPEQITDFPIADGSKLSSDGGVVRIGNRQCDYTAVLGPDLGPGENPPGTTLSADAAIGAGSLTVVAGSSVITESTGWVKVAEQYVRFTAVGATSLTIPTSGFGSLAQAVKSDTAVTWINAIQISSTQFDPPFPNGTEVVQRTTVDDTFAQADVAALEGDDGVHEQVVTDERLDVVGAQGRAGADLRIFSSVGGIVEAEWETDDVNARPGRQQDVSFEGLVTTLLITRVEITFPVKNRRPFRRCQASSLKQPGLQDVVITSRT